MVDSVITLSAIVIVFGLVVVVIITGSDQLKELLGTYTEEAENFKAAVQESLASLNISQSSAESAADMLDPRAILEYFANFIAGLAEALGNVFLIFLSSSSACSRLSICQQRSQPS